MWIHLENSSTFWEKKDILIGRAVPCRAVLCRTVPCHKTKYWLCGFQWFRIFANQCNYIRKIILWNFCEILNVCVRYVWINEFLLIRCINYKCRSKLQLGDWEGWVRYICKVFCYTFTCTIWIWLVNSRKFYKIVFISYDENHNQWKQNIIQQYYVVVVYNRAEKRHVFIYS